MWQELAIFYSVLAQLPLHIPLGMQRASEKGVSTLILCRTVSVLVFMLITHLKYIFVTCIFLCSICPLPIYRETLWLQRKIANTYLKLMLIICF